MKCIDVSEFQGRIDWNRVKADGILGVIIRAGYGNNNIDDRFHENIRGAIEAGMNIGIYWFSYAYDDDMARLEAGHCVGLLEEYKEHITLPVFFDWEYDSMKYAEKKGVKAGREVISTMTRAFCEEIELFGYTAGYYLNLDYSEHYYNEEILKPYKRWFAYYDNECIQDCYLWQTTSNGLVNGIEGNVDMDVLFGDLCVPKPQCDISTDTPEEEAGNDDMDGNTANYIDGEVYTVDVSSALNVRTGAGIEYPRVGYDNLTPDGRKHANSWGALLPGTRVTCLEVKEYSPTDIWIKIPSGWICAVSGQNRYVV